MGIGFYIPSSIKYFHPWLSHNKLQIDFSQLNFECTLVFEYMLKIGVYGKELNVKRTYNNIGYYAVKEENLLSCED